jgi:hypothetical protein
VRLALDAQRSAWHCSAAQRARGVNLQQTTAMPLPGSPLALGAKRALDT